MKIITHFLSNTPSKEIDIGRNPNIRELRDRITAAYGWPNDYWGGLKLILRLEYQERALIEINRDFPSDTDLINLLRIHHGQSDLEIQVLHVAICQLAYSFTKTQFNPNGLGPEHFKTCLSSSSRLLRFFPSNPEMKFMGEAAGIFHPARSFRQRLEDIGCNDIPEQFFDPITFEVMNDPVIASDQRTYDRSTMKLMYGQSFFTGSRAMVICENLLLRSDFEAFISSKKKRRQEYLRTG